MKAKRNVFSIGYYWITEYKMLNDRNQMKEDVSGVHRYFECLCCEYVDPTLLKLIGMWDCTGPRNTSNSQSWLQGVAWALRRPHFGRRHIHAG